MKIVLARCRAHFVLGSVLAWTTVVGCGDDGGDAGDATGGGSDAGASTAAATTAADTTATTTSATTTDTAATAGTAATTGTDTDTGGDPALRCASARPFPYPASSYAGVHAGPANDDRVHCTIGTEFTEIWHGLQGRAIAQPATFSPDGETVYVTTSEPVAGTCTLFALEAATGGQRWCVSLPQAFASSIEVDIDGNLFGTAAGAVVSYAADGTPRWSTTLTAMDPGAAAPVPVGLHFTPSGHVATVTNLGELLLFERATGAIVSRFDIPSEFGYVPLESGTALDIGALVPLYVESDFQALWGELPVSELLGVFAGTAGNFSDNTLGIAPNGDVYVIGGGPDGQRGALVQLRSQPGAGGGAPTYTRGWSVITTLGSASSPAISPDGRWVKVTDGNSTATFINPVPGGATIHMVDIAACDANTDADPDPLLCAAAVRTPTLIGPALGASPIYEDALGYSWEVALADLYDTTTPDVRALRGPDVLWEALLPEDYQWSATITVTDDLLLGTMTRLTPGPSRVLTLVLPGTATSELVGLDRATGEVVLRHPISDDGTASVSVGPDGSIYVAMLALLHTLAEEERPVGGLIRLQPAGG